MWGQRTQSDCFFDALCEAYYEKILRYLYVTLRDEQAARDVTQEVFLTACAKRGVLASHPNPGGFLFQAAKNLAAKSRREAFRRMAAECAAPDGDAPDFPDCAAELPRLLDREIDERDYIEAVLEQLTPEKRLLYDWHYLRGKSMKEIAGELGLAETTVRMRYVRLRREIMELAAQVAEENFSV